MSRSQLTTHRQQQLRSIFGLPTADREDRALLIEERHATCLRRNPTSSSSGATTSASGTSASSATGMMGYRTPNIDRVANEGALFTDYYSQQSCTAGRACFITGQNPIRTGLTKVGMPGATVGLQKEDPTIAELLKPLGYATGPVRQEPSGRPQRVPADRARVRRVLRQPLSPQRRGRAGAARLSEGSRSSRECSARAACCTAKRPTWTTRPSTRAGAGSANRRSWTPAR